MAAEEVYDRLDFMFDDCRYSSSQEEIFSREQFARGDETFPDEDYSAAKDDDYGVSRRILDRVDYLGRRRGGELVAGNEGIAKPENLGFRKGEKEGEVSGKKLGVEGEIEPQLKKFKVSPVVNCSGKMVIEGGDGGGEVVLFSGDLKVEKVKHLQPIVSESESGVKKKLEFGVGIEVINVEDEKEIGEKNGEIDDKKGGDRGEGSGKAEVGEKQGDEDGMGVMRGEGGEYIMRRRKRESGKVEGGEKGGSGVHYEAKEVGKWRVVRREEGEYNMKRRKRELPDSFFGLGWSEETRDVNCVDGSGDVGGGLKEASVEENKDGEVNGGEEEPVRGEGSRDANGNGNVESGLKDANVEEKRDGEVKDSEEESVRGEGSGGANGKVESCLKEAIVVKKGSEKDAMRCMLDVLKMLLTEECSDDDSNIDFFETAKRCGMTFPRSRFLPEIEDEDVL